MVSIWCESLCCIAVDASLATALFTPSVRALAVARCFDPPTEDWSCWVKCGGLESLRKLVHILWRTPFDSFAAFLSVVSAFLLCALMCSVDACWSPGNFSACFNCGLGCGGGSGGGCESMGIGLISGGTLSMLI